MRLYERIDQLWNGRCRICGRLLLDDSGNKLVRWLVDGQGVFSLQRRMLWCDVDWAVTSGRRLGGGCANMRRGSLRLNYDHPCVTDPSRRLKVDIDGVCCSVVRDVEDEPRGWRRSGERLAQVKETQYDGGRV